MAVPSTNIRVVLLLVAALALMLSGVLVATSSASVPPASPQAGTLIKYHGAESKAVLPLTADRIPGAPADFRALVKSQLHDLWDDLGHTQACKTAPLVTVYTIRTDGFAMGAVNTRPRPHCATGGGYVAIWAVRRGAWKQVIATQDVISCAKLEKLDIPSEIGVDECYEGLEVVPYDHP